MKRDGQSTSLWQATAEPVPLQTNLQNISGKTFDVVVAGAGITGIVTGLKLLLEGKSVLIIEANTIGFGTTGGTTAHLNTFLDAPYYQIEKDFCEKDASLVADAIRNALSLIKHNVKKYNIDCNYAEQDSYLYAQDEKQEKELRQIIGSCNKVGVAAEPCEKIPIPIEFTAAAKLSGQASFHPLRYILRLAEIFTTAGGIILEGYRVTELAENNNVVTIETLPGQTFTSKDFIYATHIPPGVNLLHFRAAPYRSYAMAVKLSDGKYPDGLVCDMYDPYHYFRTQNVDGQDYLIAGGEDHKTGHEENTDKCFGNLEDYLQENFEVEEIAYKWSSQYFEPADGLPYIGILPGYKEHVYVATGYGGNGMMHSHIAADILSDLITGKSNEFAKLFSPSRIKPIAGFSNVVKESADVTLNLIKSILPSEKIGTLDEIANEEARVIKYDGNTIAAYRDADGRLYILSPTCTHLGCTVAWNEAEKSWDCPCHGARYSYSGWVLTGPAVKDLALLNKA